MTIKRKADTGEPGNRGEFGTLHRGESDVAIASAPAMTPEQEDLARSIREQSELDDLRRRTVVIPTAKAWRAEESIDKANRRLEREGIAERFTVERTDTVTRRDPTPRELMEGTARAGEVIEIRTTTMVLNRPTIGRDGWQFDAALDRIPGTESFTMRSAGKEFGGWRPEPGRCDHCGQFRDRNKTYLVSNPETGETMQVGSSCIQAFLGVKPEGLWSLQYEFPKDLEDTDDGDGAFSAESPVMDNRTLIARALAVTDGGKGFVSKAKAEEWGKSSTVDSVTAIFETTASTDSGARLKAEMQADAAKYLADGTVDKVIEAAREVDTGSDYGRNLHDLIEAGFSGRRSQGTLISALSGYSRKLRDAEREAANVDRIANAVPGFVGAEKERVRDVPVTVTRIYEGTQTGYAYPYNEEPYQLVTMRTDDGHEIIWRVVGGEHKVGESGMLTGTVKSHEQYQGVDQTKVIRAKVETPPPPVVLDHQGIPSTGSPPPSKALRKGSKVETTARIDAVFPYSEAEGGGFSVTMRTAEGNVVFFDGSGRPPTLNATVRFAGKVVDNETGDYGRFRNVKQSALDLSSISAVAPPDPNRRPDLSEPPRTSPVGSVGDRLDKQWVVVTRSEAPVSGIRMVTVRNQDNQAISVPTREEMEPGTVAELSGAIRAHLYSDGRALMEFDDSSLDPTGETYTNGA